MGGPVSDFLFGIANALVGKVGVLLMQQGYMMIYLHDDLQEIARSLMIVRAVLLDAERQRDIKPGVSLWLSNLKVVFNDAEDLIDAIDYERLGKQAMIKAHGAAKAKVGRFFSSSNPLIFRFGMAKRLKEIKDRLAKVAADRLNFGLTIIPVDTAVNTAANTREMTHSSVITSNVIGRMNEKQRIVDLLLQPNPSNSHGNLQVLPVLGMQGLGKTTVAKLVFNDRRIANFFPLKLWVCLSDEVKFNMKHTIIKILNAANSTIAQTPTNQRGFDGIDLEQLTNLLRNRLARQKLLLILDDVGEVNRVEWVKLRDLMQVVARGSMIVMTTRLREPAQVMGTIPPLELACLSEEDSMSVFVRSAYNGGGEDRRHNAALMEIARDIVKKCGGVPLALITLGSLLFKKDDIEYWIRMRDHPIWNSATLHSDLPPLHHVISLSLDQMPSYLKHCFALFSLYPLDHAFDSFHVARLWGALGLLPTPSGIDLLPAPSGNQMLKAGVNQCLNELQSRFFLQDFVDYGIGSTFKVHTLVHDLAKHLAGSDFQLISSTNRCQCARHLSFKVSDVPSISPPPKLKTVRTILFPIAGVGANGDAFLKSILKCKHLRFLDLSDSTYETLPQSISKLKLVRYLSLENNRKLKRLPNSICKLYKLEFLVLTGCTELEALPEGLGNLANLHHLEITTKLHSLPEDEFAHLSSLHTLKIGFCNNLDSLFGGISFPTLRVLVVSDCSNLKSMPLDATHFPKLETLCIDNCGELDFSRAHIRQYYYLKLKNLYLVSLPQLVTLPHWLLPASLEYVLISSCNNLVKLPKWLSTMKLETLRVTNCPRLLTRPNDIQALSGIKHLDIDCDPGFSGSCSQSQVGESSGKNTSLEEIEELE